MVSRGRRSGTTRFSIEPEEAAKGVFVAGDFTDWQPRRMRHQSSGAFVLSLSLAAGEHEYKFLVDGQWLADPDNSSYALNPYGTVNSVVSVEAAS